MFSEINQKNLSNERAEVVFVFAVFVGAMCRVKGDGRRGNEV